MDTCDLFSSCRKGDVGRVRYLLEQRDVEVNVRDKWDSTPLYYACLCGHEELVLYLLANGARCEANTFDGERCLYGAQSEAIRRALRDYKQVTASYRRRDYYYSCLLRLLEQGIHSDVVFLVHGKSFRAHRCILGARSTYFAHMLDTKWKGKSVVVLRHPLINPVAFGALLQYLYTELGWWAEARPRGSRGPPQALSLPPALHPYPGCLDVGVEHVGDCERLAKQCQLWDLLGDLEAKCECRPPAAGGPGPAGRLCPAPRAPVVLYLSQRGAAVVLQDELERALGRGRLLSRLLPALVAPALLSPARVILASCPSLATASAAVLMSASEWTVTASSVTRPSSVAAAITSGPCWMTTSARTRSWRRQAASWPSPCTTSRPPSSPMCCTTSTVTTPSCLPSWPTTC
ncbi:ankyrin repeat and BTB/POZ domain-containing protein 1 isoform X6 [Delphinus delphis]|uniref:ankyrin repeat and BTB/POZ domain-containing protein 1 isoform X6 n=1 Tax=Delphinus delphis TaxID=9728 RepID=UPI0028C4BD0A|nr:ankyrin repeat and BTB/POZ domain-containing protein 1 isoform X6 [Delphinus delphis]